MLICRWFLSILLALPQIRENISLTTQCNIETNDAKPMNLMENHFAKTAPVLYLRLKHLL